jgi:hypothetical protein
MMNATSAAGRRGRNRFYLVIGQAPARLAEPLPTGPRIAASRSNDLILARQFCFVQSRRTRDEKIAASREGLFGCAWTRRSAGLGAVADGFWSRRGSRCAAPQRAK